MGLLNTTESEAYNIIKSFGVDINKVKEALEFLLPKGADFKGDISLTDNAKTVIDGAMSESAALNVSYVGTEHLLLAILRQQETAAAVLNEYGITEEKVRNSIKK